VDMESWSLEREDHQRVRGDFVTLGGSAVSLSKVDVLTEKRGRGRIGNRNDVLFRVGGVGAGGRVGCGSYRALAVRVGATGAA
jgi:hypothetical protein